MEDGKQGVLKMNQQIEIRPGILSKDADGKATCIPIFSRVNSLFAEANELQYAVPGGLIGVGTTVRWRFRMSIRFLQQILPIGFYKPRHTKPSLVYLKHAETMPSFVVIACKSWGPCLKSHPVKLRFQILLLHMCHM